MGAAFALCGCVESGAPADMIWLVPGFGDQRIDGGGTRAGRAYAHAEVVECSPCVPLGTGALRGCFLEDYCFSCPAMTAGLPMAGRGQELLLLPLGWGLLLPRRRGGNLAVEYGAEQPPCADAGALAAPCHWLVFRALQPIAAGQFLFIDTPPLPPVFKASQAATGVSNFAMREPGEEEEEYVLHDAPRSVRRLQSPPVALGASTVHGLGVFAARDIECGETLELVPMLPVLYTEICCSLLRDYVFGGDFAFPAGEPSDVVLLPLGFGGVYNHGARPNVYAKRYLDQPFLQAWVAQTSVLAGAELLLAYGPGYWDAPWRAAPVDAT